MSPQEKLRRLETEIQDLTRPLNGQYPRPWMTSMTNPAEAVVFIVGRNQRNGFQVDQVGSHQHYLNALFNRSAENCRQLYDRMVDKPSPTRLNTDTVVSILNRIGVSSILETNVVCYSTPMSADLRKVEHSGGTERGQEIFAVLFRLIKPRVIIAHGSGTAEKLARFMGAHLPDPPAIRCDPAETVVGETSVFVIPSLAPPQFNKWSGWFHEHMEKVCEKVATIMRRL